MIRVAVVDDNEKDCERLIQNLRRYEKENSPGMDIRVFRDGEDFLADYKPRYDLILLDIEMPGMNGMETARAIRRADEGVPIVFITNMPQYAIEGYKVRALDYMLKPVSWPSFCETVTRALRYVEHREAEYVIISSKDTKRKLDVAGICYVEVRDHLLLYHTVNGIFESKGTMHDAQKALEAKNFFRIHRCYLISLSWVDSYGGNDVTVAGDRLLLSRNRRKPFLDALNCYMNEVHT